MAEKKRRQREEVERMEEWQKKMQERELAEKKEWEEKLQEVRN